MDIAKSKFGVEFSKDKTFKIFITLSTARGESNPSRKQYFGLLEDGKVYRYCAYWIEK